MSYEPPPSSPDPAGQSPQYEPPAPAGSGASAPPPGYGPPVDPYVPPSDPYNTPPPTAVWNPQPGGGDPYTPPGGYGPPSGDPYAPPGGGYGPPSGDPYAPPGGGYAPPPTPPYGPTSGAPYPPPGPSSGAPYTPSSGAPYAPSSGAGYNPPDPYAPSSGAGYVPPPPGGPAYGPPPGAGPAYGPPPAVGMPMMPVAPPKKSNTMVIVLAVVGVLLVLCCGGGIVALVAAGDGTDDPGVTYSPPAQPGLPTTAPTRGTDTPPPATDDETENMAIGDTLILTSSDGDELRVTVQKVTTRKTGCRSYAPEPDNGTYLVADVTVEVVKGTGSINPLYFNFVDSSGTEENGLGGIFAGCGTALSSGVDLAAGTKRSGTVVFDVKSAKGQIVYAELLGGNARGSWKVG